jgi:hypothetical protein
LDVVLLGWKKEGEAKLYMDLKSYSENGGFLFLTQGPEWRQKQLFLLLSLGGRRREEEEEEEEEEEKKP